MDIVQTLIQEILLDMLFSADRKVPQIKSKELEKNMENVEICTKTAVGHFFKHKALLQAKTIPYLGHSNCIEICSMEAKMYYKFRLQLPQKLK